MRKIVGAIALMLACSVVLVAQTLSPQVRGFVKVDSGRGGSDSRACD
jgi:hypothetical protein